MPSLLRILILHQLTHSHNHPGLIIIQITRMRMLHTILGHQRRSHHPIRHEVFPEIQDPLRHFRRAFEPVDVAVAGPYQFGLCLVCK